MSLVSQKRHVQSGFLLKKRKPYIANRILWMVANPYMPTNSDSHGFKLVQDFVHAQYFVDEQSILGRACLRVPLLGARMPSFVFGKLAAGLRRT